MPLPWVRRCEGKISEASVNMFTSMAEPYLLWGVLLGYDFLFWKRELVGGWSGFHLREDVEKQKDDGGGGVVFRLVFGVFCD